MTFAHAIERRGPTVTLQVQRGGRVLPKMCSRDRRKNGLRFQAGMHRRRYAR